MYTLLCSLGIASFPEVAAACKRFAKSIALKMSIVFPVVFRKLLPTSCRCASRAAHAGGCFHPVEPRGALTTIPSFSKLHGLCDCLEPPPQLGTQHPSFRKKSIRNKKKRKASKNNKKRKASKKNKKRKASKKNKKRKASKKNKKRKASKKNKKRKASKKNKKRKASKKNKKSKQSKQRITRKEKPARRTRKEKPARRTRKEKQPKQTKNNKKRKASKKNKKRKASKKNKKRKASKANKEEQEKKSQQEEQEKKSQQEEQEKKSKQSKQRRTRKTYNAEVGAEVGRRRWRLFPSHPSAGCGWNQHRIEHFEQFLFSALGGQRNRLQLEGPGSPCVMRSSTALSSSRVRHTDPTRGARTILQGARVQGPARVW